MPDMPGEKEKGEWLTVAECAARMGIDPRQVRRYAARLKAGDRQEGHGQDTVLRVRYEAILKQRFRNDSQSDGRQGHPRDTDRTRVPVSLNEAVLLRELLKEKDARIATLEETIRIQQGNIEDLRRLLPAGPEAPDAIIETISPDMEPQEKRRGFFARLFRRS